MVPHDGGGLIMWTTVVGILLRDLTAHDVHRTLN